MGGSGDGGRLGGGEGEGGSGWGGGGLGGGNGGGGRGTGGSGSGGDGVGGCGDGGTGPGGGEGSGERAPYIEEATRSGVAVAMGIHLDVNLRINPGNGGRVHESWQCGLVLELGDRAP